HRFAQAGIDPHAAEAHDRLLAIGRDVFDEAALPLDVDAVWWPRFRLLARGIIDWERSRSPSDAIRLAEAGARHTMIGATGVTLSGRADRIDLHGDGLADILDFKT